MRWVVHLAGEKFSKDVSAHKKMIKAVAVSYCTQMAT